ncbi:MAG TPA: flagellar hook-length control protein FliK [Pyrinomonadaceae bacterium]|jgi:hypothetical protein
MKVTPPKNTPEPPPTTNNITSRRVSSQTNTVPHEDDGALASVHTTRDFASVLEDVTRTAERDDNESSEGERQETKSSAHAERERESKRREDRHDGGTGGGGFEQRGQVRDAGHISEAAPARAILHIADLERIVAAVRTQLISGGRQEVTLELHRSVLEGLRVRLTTDGQGRVNAEFITASEKLRAQLDARAGDLSDLLRGRGVELASLRTTVGANGDQTTSGDGGRHAPDNPPRVLSGRDGAHASAAAEDASQDERAADESTSSYRA